MFACAIFCMWISCMNLLLILSVPGHIMFLQQPRNVTVPEGADAFFACTYNGTTGVPDWKISNNVYVTLPPRHSYNGTGLVVRNVDLSQNVTPYSCFFTVYIEGGQLIDIESTTGFLLIAGWHTQNPVSVCKCFHTKAAWYSFIGTLNYSGLWYSFIYNVYHRAFQMSAWHKDIIPIIIKAM